MLTDHPLEFPVNRELITQSVLLKPSALKKASAVRFRNAYSLFESGLLQARVTATTSMIGKKTHENNGSRLQPTCRKAL